MSRADIEKAIAYIKECRETHVVWSDYLKENPEWGKEQRTNVEAGGGIAHHDEWVRKYDHVLQILSGCADGEVET